MLAITYLRVCVRELKLQQKTAAKKHAAFVRVGLQDFDDVSYLSTCTEEIVDEIMDEFIREGLNWRECKAVVEGLKNLTAQPSCSHQ